MHGLCTGWRDIAAMADAIDDATGERRYELFVRAYAQCRQRHAADEFGDYAYDLSCALATTDAVRASKM